MKLVEQLEYVAEKYAEEKFGNPTPQQINIILGAVALGSGVSIAYLQKMNRLDSDSFPVQ